MAHCAAEPGAEVEARHAREYTPREMHNLLEDSGFAVERLETGEFLDKPRPEERYPPADYASPVACIPGRA